MSAVDYAHPAPLLRACPDVLIVKAVPVHDVIARNHDAIVALCRQYGVLRLDLFGSAATGTFDPETSDFDFIATFADTDVPGYARRYLAFAEALEALLGRAVDLLTEGSIRNPYFRQAVDATRKQVFVEHDAPAVA